MRSKRPGSTAHHHGLAIQLPARWYGHYRECFLPAGSGPSDVSGNCAAGPDCGQDIVVLLVAIVIIVNFIVDICMLGLIHGSDRQAEVSEAAILPAPHVGAGFWRRAGGIPAS